MRKRAPRVVTALAIVTAGLGVCLVALEGDALAEQIAVWRVRLSGGAAILPARGSPRKATIDLDAGSIPVMVLLSAIADTTGRTVIVSAAERECLDGEITLGADMHGVTTEILVAILEVNGVEVSRGTDARVNYVKRCPAQEQAPIKPPFLWTGE